MTRVTMVSDGAEPDKIARLVTALETSGITVTGDEAGEAGKKCAAPVVVRVWTRAAVATYARTLDARLAAAAANQRLVSVLFEKTRLPSDLPPHPSLDLIGWRSSPENEAFLALVRAIELAAVEQRKGFLRRLSGRAVGGLTAGAIFTFSYVFVTNVVAIQDQTCSIAFAQPHLSDACGFFGLGGKPSRAERLAWEGLPPRSCDALRDFIRRYPEGGLHDVAADVLAARTVFVVESWEAERRPLPLFVAAEGAARTSTAAARTDAQAQGQLDAERLCRGFAASGAFEFVSAGTEPVSWRCDEYASGHVCGFEGSAVCELRRRKETRDESCERVR